MFARKRKSLKLKEPSSDPYLDPRQVGKEILECLPINVMIAEAETGVITFYNTASQKTLKALSRVLPGQVDPDNLLGKRIGEFHKNPETQYTLIKDETKLPMRSRIKLGTETLELNISPLYIGGSYYGALLCWSPITAMSDTVDNFTNNMTTIMQELETAVNGMQCSAKNVFSSAEEAENAAINSAAGAEEASTNVEVVSEAASALSRATEDVLRQVTHSSDVARTAVEKAEQTTQTVAELAQASEKIGRVVSIIQEIASQTNLLALNATIEAARAGDAGRSFAVVATEVKNLAAQTTKATEEITGQIQTIQFATTAAVEAIGKITETIQDLSGLSDNVSDSVQTQNNTTGEISRNLAEAAAGVRSVSENLSSVQNTIRESRTLSERVMRSSEDFRKNTHSVVEQTNQLKVDFNQVG